MPEGVHRSGDIVKPASGSRDVATYAILLMLAPMILFYSALYQTTLNLPIIDDYDAVLKFMNGMVQTNGASAKFLYFLGFQKNEYKLFFDESLYWLQLHLQGKIDFKVLCAVGAGFVLPLFLLLWKMFLPRNQNLTTRLVYFIPVAWLLFQLQYYGALDCAMTVLANTPVLVFAFAAIYLLLKPRRIHFCVALVCLALAIGTLGSGFVLVPVGLLILAVGRQFARIMGWLAVTAICVAAYAFHYNVMSSQTAAHQSVFSALLRIRLDYVIAFIGNAGGVGGAAGVAIGLGALLCLFFGWMVVRGYPRRNPCVAYCVLFLLLTAVGVAGIRSDFGLDQSLTSRYTLYGALFLIFAWFAIVEEFLQRSEKPFLNNGSFLAATALVILFSLCMDLVGYESKSKFNVQFVQGMIAFEHPSTPESTDGPALPIPNEPPRYTAFRPVARAILMESIRLGVYRPPQL